MQSYYLHQYLKYAERVNIYIVKKVILELNYVVIYKNYIVIQIHYYIQKYTLNRNTWQ